MAPLFALKAVDKLLQNLMKNNLPYGGKTIVLGGDFRQVTPVLPKASKAVIVQNSIKNTIKKSFHSLKLSINMRADKDEKFFADWLLKIGNGQEKNYNEFGEDMIKIPYECIVKDDLIEDLYGKITDPEQFKDICCLTTRNDFVDEINERVLKNKIEGEVITKLR